MKQVALLVWALVWLAGVGAEEKLAPYLELGPMVGHAGADQARIWIKASAQTEWGVRVWREGEEAAAGTVFTGSPLEEATYFMGQALLTGLKPATRYNYVVLINKLAAQFPPYPSFLTAQPPGEQAKFRFAFGSCVGARISPAPTWADMAVRVKIDMLLMLGDNHYADSTDPAVQWPKYYEQRALGGFKEVTASTPTYGIWDDHDYGPNDGDGTAPGKERSLAFFKQVWANPSYGEPDNPGVYYKFSRGDVDFFMLDGRYHRTPNPAPEDGKKTMLGEKQLAWLQRELKASPARLKFVANGSEFQTFGTGDSWTSFDRERQILFKFIDENAIKGVVFLSGDRHFTAGYHVQGKWIEISSGPLGARSNSQSGIGPEMFLRHSELNQYCIFDVDMTRAKPLILEVYKAGAGLLQKQYFSWQEINGETKIPPLPPKPDMPKEKPKDK